MERSDTLFAEERVEEESNEEYNPGQMTINPEAIHDAREIDHAQFRAIGHEIAPFLFLEGMTEAQLMRIQSNQVFLSTTRQRLFLEATPETGFRTDEVVEVLFRDEDYLTQTGVASGTIAPYFHLPVWLLVVGAILLTGLFAYLAAMLGKRLGHVIHTKKEDEVIG